jgi:hypothetical protein
MYVPYHTLRPPGRLYHRRMCDEWVNAFPILMRLK